MPSRTFPSAPPAIVAWRAPLLAPVDVASMPPPLEKSVTPKSSAAGQPMQIGTDRPLEKSAAVPQWQPVTGGYVAKFRASSEGALGIRLRLELGTVPGAFELVAQGSGSDRLESMTIDPTLGNTHWTPWTEGSSQVVELFSPVLPSPGAVSLAGIGHFFDSPIQPKASAGSCTVPAACGTGNATLDAAIAERVKSNVKITFSDGSGLFLCTATLDQQPSTFPAPFLLTANHCMSTDDRGDAQSRRSCSSRRRRCTDPGASPALHAGERRHVARVHQLQRRLDAAPHERAAARGAVFSGWTPRSLPTPRRS